MIKKRIKNCDLFGEQVEFNLEGETQHTTYFGSLLSFILILGMTFVIYADVKKLVLY